MELPSIINKAQMKREAALWEAVIFLLKCAYPAGHHQQRTVIKRLLEEMNANALSDFENGTESTCETTGREKDEGD